jgi:hypothetical protein
VGTEGVPVETVFRGVRCRGLEGRDGLVDAGGEVHEGGVRGDAVGEVVGVVDESRSLTS